MVEVVPNSAHVYGRSAVEVAIPNVTAVAAPVRLLPEESAAVSEPEASVSSHQASGDWLPISVSYAG